MSDDTTGRAEALERARGLAELDGGTLDPATVADQEAWAAGQISHEELMERVTARIRGWNTGGDDAGR